ncbi:MAG: SurA N-terminal domain-containing protein [Sphaerochaeta sp.]
MSSNDNTNGKKPEDNGKVLAFGKEKKGAVEKKGNNEAALKPKRKITIGWVFGMIVLILIAISFVLAPAIQAFVGQGTSNGIVFGTYGKDEIKYAYGNYFHDQVQNYANQYSGSQENQTQALYQIWKSAYDSTVLFTAINQLASKAGIIAADEVVKRAIIESGAYDKDGKFDVKTYQDASAETKASVEQSIRRGLPYQMVIDDVGTVLSSTAEVDYIADMAGNGRTFRYLSLEPSLYPDELASQYALQNKQLFFSMDMSIISVDSQERAQTLYDAIANGEKSFEDAAIENSMDSYAAEGGKIGNLYYYGLVSNFKNSDEAVALLSAESGDVLGPYESNGAWALYKLNSTPEEPDYASEQLLASVKAYLATSDSGIIDTYLADLAADMKQEAASKNLDEVALAHDLDVMDVSATPYNLGGSQYMSDFSYTDNRGMLASAAADEAVAEQLYSAGENTLLDPIKSGNSYLLVEVGSDVQDDSMGSYISMFYDYYSGAQNQQDFSQALYSSDLFEDNFLTTFLDVVIGQNE